MEENIFSTARKEVYGKDIFILMRDDYPVQVCINGQDLHGEFKYDESRSMLKIEPVERFPFIECYIPNNKKWWQFWKPDLILMPPFQIKIP